MFAPRVSQSSSFSRPISMGRRRRAPPPARQPSRATEPLQQKAWGVIGASAARTAPRPLIPSMARFDLNRPRTCARATGTMRIDGPTPITSGRCATSPYRFHNGELRPDRPTLPPPRALDRPHPSNLTGSRPSGPVVAPAASTWGSCSLPALAGLEECDDDPMRYSTSASLSWVSHATSRSSIRSARHTTGAQMALRIGSIRSLESACDSPSRQQQHGESWAEHCVHVADSEVGHVIFGIPAHVAAPPPPPLLASLDERTQARAQPTEPSARLVELGVIFRMTCPRRSSLS